MKWPFRDMFGRTVIYEFSTALLKAKMRMKQKVTVYKIGSLYFKREKPLNETDK